MDRVQQGKGKEASMKKLAIIIMMILAVDLALGLGVGPVKKHITYSPGDETVELKIINNDRRDLRIAVYAKGDLENLMSFREQILIIPRDREYTQFSYTVKMPQGMKAGTNKANIYFLELPEEFDTAEQTLVTATTAVVHQVEVQVPYPGKYAEAKLNIDPSSLPIAFSMPVYNFGSERIKNASVKIGIFGPTYEKIAEFDGTSVSIEPQQEAKLNAQWMPDVNPGTYLAIATIDYDGQKIRLEEQFAVSNLVISIRDVKVRPFDIGEIAVFDISLESMWGEAIEDVYAELLVNKRGTELTSFKTAAIDMPALGKATLNGYWDTSGIEEGGYEITVTVFYAGRSVSKTSDMLVTVSGSHIYTPTAKATEKSGFLTKEVLLTSLVVILIVIVIVLIILNLKWMRRRPPPPRGI